MKNEKGVTLISLITIVVVLLILSSVATYSGISVIKSAKLTAFSTELKIMQTKVNEIYENNKETIEDISKKGKDIKDSIKIQAEKVSSEIFGTPDEITDQNGYRFWNQETIKDLKIEGVEGEFFVNLKKRSVISYQGFEYEGKTYYTLNQLPDSLYNVEYEETQVNEPTFKVYTNNIGNNKWRITVSDIEYDGYISKWQVKYKLEGQDWKTSEDLSFVINQQGNYSIQLVNMDHTIESGEEKILVQEYAKEGLLLYYDAINNIGEGDDKHSTTTTKWKDLSGNNQDAELKNFFDYENSKWNNNYLQFDGINDYAQVPDSDIIKPKEQTIEIVFNRTGDTDYKDRSIIFVKWYGYTVELNKIDGNNHFTVSYARNASASTYLKSNRSLELNKIYALSLTHEQNISKIYINTEFECQNEVTPTDYNSASLLIGKYSDTTFLKGNIYAIRMYNRVLTQEEMQNNHKIDQERFGL